VNISANPNIKLLNLSKNNLTTIDFKNNTKITQLILSQNDIATLDITPISSLERLVVEENYNLGNIDFSGNPELHRVECLNTSMSVLDFSSNPVVRIIQASNNSLLRQIDVKASQESLFIVTATGCPLLGCVQVRNEVEVQNSILTAPERFTIGAAIFSENCNY